MSRLNQTIIAAGLAGSLFAAAQSRAADLLPPPPPPEDIGPVFAGGWYLRGDVGVGALRLDSFEGTDSESFRSNYPETTAAGYYKPEQKSLGDQAFIGVGVGYEFNGFLRGDVTAEYRTAAVLKYAESYPGFYPDGTPGTGLDFYHGQLSTFVTMANGYIDLGTWHGLTPFVGGGVGAAFHKVSGLTDRGGGTANGGAGIIGDKSSSSFAWNVQAGLAYSITPYLKLEAAYRYMHLGQAASGTLQCYDVPECPGTTFKFKDVTSQDVKIGMRWLLGGVVAAPLPALVPDYAPGPLVRKY